MQFLQWIQLLVAIYNLLHLLRVEFLVFTYIVIDWTTATATG